MYIKTLKFVVGAIDRVIPVESFKKDVQSLNDTELLNMLGLDEVCVTCFLNFGK